MKNEVKLQVLQDQRSEWGRSYTVFLRQTRGEAVRSRRKTATEIWISSRKHRSDTHIHLSVDTVDVSTDALQPCCGCCLLADLPLSLTAVRPQFGVSFLLVGRWSCEACSRAESGGRRRPPLLNGAVDPQQPRERRAGTGYCLTKPLE